MKQKYFILSVFLCFSLFLFSSCTSSVTTDTPATKTETIVLGFSQLGSESAFRLGNSKSIQDAAEKAGIQLMFENAEQKQENQIKAIRSFIAYRVDVIAFAPIVEDGWRNVLQEAKDAGIPVLTTDRKINSQDEPLIAGFVGSDFYQQGKKAGEYLVQKANHMDVQLLNIVEITGTIDSTPMRQRYQGFQDITKHDQRFKIIDSTSGDFLRSKGKECMASFLQTYDHIDVLYSHNDAMTLGAIEAIEEKGLLPGKDIIIITVDGEQAAIDLLKEGKINCVIECTPMIGDIVMDLSKRLAAGETIDRHTYPPEVVFTEFDENLQSIAQRGY
ncbi:MAG: ABC transporter substrate-binding protein [Clostridiales bacterium]|nr:ABC transporter substrate-binding protein [Clostridiales bacterium]